ncbi:MAG: CPBP family intramembrane glutamic endopeptidase [Opitutales bacterium]
MTDSLSSDERPQADGAAVAASAPQWVPHLGALGTPLAARTRQLWLGVECAVLFWGIPLALLLQLIPGRGLRVLGILTLGIIALLLADRSFRFKSVFHPLRKADLKRALGRGLLIGAGVFLFAWLGDRVGLWPYSGPLWADRPERFGDTLFMGFVLARPDIWALVMCLYPIFSALPQEIIGRTFFFHRYGEIFRSEGAMITASTLSFAFMHIIFQNWIALVFCLIGGYLFSHTYAKTRSLTAVWLEHSLYGCLIFTSGLGFFFFYTGQQVIR